jgi:hypothetical protein
MKKQFGKKCIFLLALIFVLTAGWACTTPAATGPGDKTWVSPGKIQINNLKPGNSVKQTIRIHNGSEPATKFLIYYRIPDYVENNYIAAPVNAMDWIIIPQNSLLIEPRATKEIQVVLNLPDKAKTPERWEFWIGVKSDKENRLATELCSRWLITMKD